MALNGDKNGGGWKRKREARLFWAGLAVIGAEFIVPDLLGWTFHFEWILAGLALCGVAITQWGDKR